MSSDDILIDPCVLSFMKQIEEPSLELARRPIDSELLSNPKLRRTSRKLSEPAHKSSVPARPILRSVGSMQATTSPAFHSLPNPYARSLPSAENSVPLSFASRNKVPPSVGPPKPLDTSNRLLSSESHNDLFWTPGSTRKVSESGARNGKSVEGRKDYWGKWEKNNDRTGVSSDGSPTGAYSGLPTPLPTPKLRSSFSQDLPHQGYPLTPRNTIRVKRRPPPVVDELDRQRNSVAFPSRQSFTFSPPRDYQPPPPLPQASENVQPGRRSSITPRIDSISAPSRRVSWRPSLPNFSRRSHEKPRFLSSEPERTASKRKSNADSELQLKRRKVQFMLPAEHKQHPPIKRRLTPYYEPFSSKVQRMLFSLIAPFRKSEEDKAEDKKTKMMKKREKMARKEREELAESFRHFDDLVD